MVMKNDLLWESIENDLVWKIDWRNYRYYEKALCVMKDNDFVKMAAMVKKNGRDCCNGCMCWK